MSEIEDETKAVVEYLMSLDSYTARGTGAAAERVIAGDGAHAGYRAGRRDERLAATAREDELRAELVLVARTQSPIRLGPTSAALAGALTKADERIDAMKKALALVFPVEHYGEPEGLTNCPVNPFISPSTDQSIGEREPGVACDCGADETNGRIRELLESVGISSEELEAEVSR